MFCSIIYSCMWKYMKISLSYQTYMAPWLSIFGDFTKDPEVMYNNFRVYGTCLLLLMGKFLFLWVERGGIFKSWKLFELITKLQTDQPLLIQLKLFFRVSLFNNFLFLKLPHDNKRSLAFMYPFLFHSILLLLRMHRVCRSKVCQ